MTSASSSNHPTRRFALEVVRRLQQAGFQALWAGGCVRDELLRTEPVDYDVATSARPAEVRELFGAARTLPIGQSFGVIAVRGPRGAGVVEVATFRQDGPYSDGRHPDAVQFSDAEHDAQRRDFTINGLFLDPLQGQVYDYVGGVADLEAGKIRAIGDPAARFAEDHLRLLRAPRFAARLGFAIEPTTLAAIRGSGALLATVAAERVGNELRMMLGQRGAAAALASLQQTDLLRWVAPSFVPYCDDPRRVAAATASLQRLAGSTFELVTAALVWCLATEPSAAIDDLAARWKLSNKEREQIEWLVEHVATLAHGQGEPWPRLQRLLISPAAPLGIDLARALAGHGPWTAADVEFSAARLGWEPAQLNPPPLLSGHDLTALQIPAGPLFGQLLTAIRDRQLLGELLTREAALAAVPGLYRQLAMQAAAADTPAAEQLERRAPDRSS